MNNLKNIAIMAIISLMFVAKTSVAQVSDSARVAKAQALADSLYWDSYEFQLTSYYEYKKDSILDVLTMSNNLSKRERLLLQGELKGIENAQALLDTHAQIQIANGNAQIVKAEQTANTIVCVEQGKCDVATAKAGSFVAQEEDKTSYYTNKTNMRNSMGDLKSGIVPTAKEAKEQPGYDMAVYKAGRLSNSQMRTELKKEKAERKKLRKYGPQKEEKPADVEWNSTEQKSTSNEAGQNVQVQQPVQYGQANNLPPILNGGTAKVSTTQPSTIYGRPVVWINGVAYFRN